jgi:FkbM family methyltransferase
MALRRLARSLLRGLGHTEYLRFGVRDRMIRMIDNPDISGSEEFSVPFFGARYSGNFNCFLDWSVFYYGAYAREELRLMRDLLLTFDDPVVFDVGANIGHHTLFAALHARKVYAFEPFSGVAKQLLRKISENRLTNVTLFEFALGDTEGSATYTPPSSHNTGTGSFAATDTTSATILLPIRTGDQVAVENNINEVHFIKIDAEGFEPFVLRGLRRILNSCRPAVFFEWTDVRRELSKNQTGLFPDDYRVFQFFGESVVMGLFRRREYRLRALREMSEWRDGNLLALPIEHIERLRPNDRLRAKLFN